MEAVLVHYLDADGNACIEAVPVYDTERLAELLSIGGEIIPQ